MPLVDSATLAIDTGHYFTAPVGTSIPTLLTSVGSPWSEIGNTSLENVLSIKSDGGDASVLATLQNRNLRTRRSNRSEVFSVTLEQFDQPALQLYYGSNAVKNSDGTLTVPSQPTPTTVAFLAVFIDGTNTFAFYAPKAEIIRGDDIDIKDTDSLVGLPLSITPLNYQSNNWAYSVTPLTASDPAPAATA